MRVNQNFSRNTDRVQYVICSSKKDFDKKLMELQATLINGNFFRETLSYRGLVIYKIRDYKFTNKDGIGCPQCAQVYKKREIYEDMKSSYNDTCFQRKFTCPQCKTQIGWVWTSTREIEEEDK